MKVYIQNILDLAKLKRVAYADIRIVHRQLEEVEVKNGNVEALTHNEDLGFGIRVLYKGAWGFACSSKVTKGEMERVLGKALRIAKASSTVMGKSISFLGPLLSLINTKPLIQSILLMFPSKQN